MDKETKLYQELDNISNNIKLIELKIKKNKFFIETLLSNKPYIFQIKKYNKYKSNLNTLYKDYNKNNDILFNELLNLEKIQEQIHKLSNNQ